ncbi:MAG: hypothetical protein B6I28_03595 [Fusobacteriia bacterium 4572_132]|nr:MAG: hypothetical protein B6I28_03595 [Fusobacteriia bacterium 4572_132]
MKKRLLILFILVLNITYSRQKIGVVLSGGGAKGFAHIGVLKILERENIPIDYIGGTSMGGIIAALYSIGYTTEELENIAKNKNWMEVLNDEIERKDLTMEEKMEGKKTFISIPVEEWNLKIPSGLISGQKIEIFLHELTWGIFGERKFENFPIPFVCLATDIETGKEVELKRGNIVKALRTTMSIPTIFNPVIKGDKLLVDGMLSQNFPVSNVKKMGADIIIGVDVGKNLSLKKDLDSMLKIIEQAFNLRGIESANNQRKLTDILIIPKLGELSSSSFDQGKELIKLGEKAAEEKIDEIKKYSVPNNKKRLKMVEMNNKVYIKKIEINGKSEIEKKNIKKIMNFNLPELVSKEEMSEKIRKLYGTRLFKKVEYDVKNSILVLNLIENDTEYFKLGLNYNDYTKASILMSSTLKKGMLKKGITNFNLKLGEYPSFTLTLKKYRGIIKKVGINAEIGYIELPYYLYENNKKIALYDFENNYAKLYLNSILNKNILFEIGIKEEMIEGNSKISSSEYEKYRENHMFYYFLTRLDMLDNKYYPKKGILYEEILEVGEKKLASNADYIKIKFKFNTNIPLNKEITFLNIINIAYIDGNTIPIDKYISIGGIQENEYSIPFYGLQANEIMSKNILVNQLGMQYEFKKDRFLQIKYNKVIFNEKFRDLIKNMNSLDGVGIVLGSNTPLGPIELGIGKATSREYQTYINIGYKF